MPGKPLYWVGSAHDDIRAFPRAAKRRAGQELYRVQLGRQPLDWRPMSSVGVGVNEIRIHTGLEHRVLYIAKFAEGIYVLHVFEKRSRTTPHREIELARQRLRNLLRWRSGRGPRGEDQWR